LLQEPATRFYTGPSSLRPHIYFLWHPYLFAQSSNRMDFLWVCHFPSVDVIQRVLYIHSFIHSHNNDVISCLQFYGFIKYQAWKTSILVLSFLET